MQRYENEGKDNTSNNKTEEVQEVPAPNEKTGEVFVKNLAFRTTNEGCKKFFEEFGKVKNVNILQRDGRSRGVGFVTFEDPKDAIALIESKKELVLEERPLTVSWPSSQKQESHQRSDAKTNTIFVGNLSYKATDKGIEDFFADCGKVISVRIAVEYDGRSKGFCYVDFENEEAVTKALNNKNGKLFEEREIRVDRALPKSDGDRHYNGGRGRGRGDRGYGRGYGRGGFNHDDNREFHGRGRGERGRGRGRGGNDDNYEHREYHGNGRGRGRGGESRGRGRGNY